MDSLKKAREELMESCLGNWSDLYEAHRRINVLSSCLGHILDYLEAQDTMSRPLGPRPESEEEIQDRSKRIADILMEHGVSGAKRD